MASYVPGAPDDADPSYLMLSGTSTSAPVGAGVAALMIGQNPSLSPDDVKVRMIGTADPLPGATRFQQGAGLLDAAGALASHARSNGYALSEDVGDGTTILTENDYAAWDTGGMDEVRMDEVPVDKVPVDEVPVDEVPVDGRRLAEVPVDEVQVDEHGLDQVPVDQFRWTNYDWAKFRWTILTEGQ